MKRHRGNLAKEILRTCRRFARGARHGAGCGLASAAIGWAFLCASAVWAGQFGEGYSSAEPGAPSDLHYRAFTIYTAQEACAQSAMPSEFRVRPDPLRLAIGDRIHRSNVNRHPSELVIEAYGPRGEFLPSVPIIVSTMDLQNVTRTRSDWDYFEAAAEGEDELVVAWACGTPDGAPVQTRVRLIVSAERDLRE